MNVNVIKNKNFDIFKSFNHEKHFYYRENVKEIKYLLIVFSRSGSFCKAKKHLIFEQAQKALYGVLRKFKFKFFNLQCKLAHNSICLTKLFLPVLINETLSNHV